MAKSYGFDISGPAATAQEAVDLAAAHRPDAGGAMTTATLFPGGLFQLGIAIREEADATPGRWITYRTSRGIEIACKRYPAHYTYVLGCLKTVGPCGDARAWDREVAVTTRYLALPLKTRWVPEHSDARWIALTEVEIA